VVVPGVLSGAGWLLGLAGYLLFVVAACRNVLHDMCAYREDLRSASQEALRQTQELQSLVETTRAVSESLDLDLVFSRAARAASIALNADRCAIFLVDPGEFETVRLVAQYDLLQRGDPGGAQATTTLAGQALLDRALRERNQLILSPETHREQLGILYGLLDRQAAGPTIVQPLFHQDRALGVLIVGNDRSQRAFGPSEGRLCQSIAEQVATAIENARLHRDLGTQTERLAGLLQSQEQDLRKQAAILESISDGVIVSDREGVITVVNTAAERILDAGRERLLGQSVEGALGHSPVGPKADWRLAVESGAPLETVVELEGKNLYINAAPALTSTGDHGGIVAVLRDITREVEAERARDSFIATISHELLTPITAIRGYAEALGSGMVGAVSEIQSHYLGIIRDNALRMSSSAENLIAASEIEMGFLRLQYEETDLHLLTRHVLHSFRSQIENRKLDVRLALDADLPVIEADPSRVRQILDNLVGNAVKFTYPGGRITIEARPLVEDTDGAPMHCTIEVSDTGIGISQEEQAHIWERFYRPASPQAEEAATKVGMGLSVVKSLAEAHGGRVWMESTPSVGSTFTVLLPIKRAQTADRQGS
jgi:PAS domain S-box-containing protein